MFYFYPFVLAIACLSSLSQANDISDWLEKRVPTSQQYLSNNISSPGYKKGFVIAAPWMVPGVQDYRFHWVRDAGIVMGTVATNYLYSENAKVQTQAFDQLRDFINFSKENQIAPETGPELIGLGEVKFNPDGSRFTKWMRPQNDGPALRAITIMRFARSLIKDGNIALAQHLYNGSQVGSNGFNAPSVVKDDLDYVAEHWNDITFDPWEEVKGRHFYTSMVQRKALVDGQTLALTLGDVVSAEKYKTAGLLIEKEVERHWLPAGKNTPMKTKSQGQIWDTFDQVYGPNYKVTGLDVSVVLASLHSHNEFDTETIRFYSPSHSRVLRTAHLIARAFEGTFPLSKVATESSNGPVGTPIGRYPHDKYNGYTSELDGNPWFLATAAFAELYYRCALEWEQDQKIVVNETNLEFLTTLLPSLTAGETIRPSDKRFGHLVSAIRALGDSYLRRVKLHEVDGHLTEQYSRVNGTKTGAEDLTWSYSALITAAISR